MFAICTKCLANLFHGFFFFFIFFAISKRELERPVAEQQPYLIEIKYLWSLLEPVHLGRMLSCHFNFFPNKCISFLLLSFHLVLFGRLASINNFNGRSSLSMSQINSGALKCNKSIRWRFSAVFAQPRKQNKKMKSKWTHKRNRILPFHFVCVLLKTNVTIKHALILNRAHRTTSHTFYSAI